MPTPGEIRRAHDRLRDEERRAPAPILSSADDLERTLGKKRADKSEFIPFDGDWREFVSGKNMGRIVELWGYDPRGCGLCSYGIVAEPDTEHICAPLFMRRAIAASRGAVLFCTCPAGKAMEGFVADTLAKIPAWWLDGNDKNVLEMNGKGRPRWRSGTPPKYYVPPHIVKAVLKEVDRLPNFGGK